jgi:hypothetical protein
MDAGDGEPQDRHRHDATPPDLLAERGALPVRTVRVMLGVDHHE